MKSERGNVIIYLLIGIVLFGAMLTGVWWVKKKNTQTVSAPIATNSQKQSDSPETTIHQDAGGSTQAQSEQNNSGTPSTTGSATTPQATAPSPQYPQQSSSTSTNQPSNSSQSATNTTPSAGPSTPESQTAPTGTTHANGVAATGPVEDMTSALALGGVIYTATLYVRSRRRLV